MYFFFLFWWSSKSRRRTDRCFGRALALDIQSDQWWWEGKLSNCGKICCQLFKSVFEVQQEGLLIQPNNCPKSVSGPDDFDEKCAWLIDDLTNA